MIVGYARVSSTGQDHQTQVDRLKAVGCEKVFSEKLSGLDRDRPELQKALEFVREGDVLVITKLDRLARSASHLHQIVDGLTAKGVGFKVLDDSGIDTTTRSGNCSSVFSHRLPSSRPHCGVSVSWTGSPRRRPRKDWRPTGADHLRAQSPDCDHEEGGASVRQIAAQVGFSKSAVQKVIEETR